MTETANQRIKKLILSKIEKVNGHVSYDSLSLAIGYINCLEAIPVGQQNEPHLILEDVLDGVIDELKARERLLLFLDLIPD